MNWKIRFDAVDGYSLQLRHQQFRVVVYENCIQTYRVVVIANNPECSCWFSTCVDTLITALSLGEEKFREFKKPYDG